MKNTKLKRLRLAHLWTISQAANKVGVSTLTFSRWENGVQRPQLVYLASLCSIFGKTPEELGYEDLVRVDEMPRPHEMVQLSRPKRRLSSKL
ncbi:helix-turn-helix transcriptional regulator [Ktedonobacter racemifer]|uniref:Transcriptional regulator, XRE family n=1 Tax=Ktedonobacter racemifer DSM 44963 TaxID=485913 RepID=D6TDC8_KTERA|nr:transcriptional regulator, XRE family [Ktedonobacter racemifer DSM 44963]